MLETSISVLLPVLFVIALGYWAGRRKQFDSDQVQGVNELVIDYALPALMFAGIATTTRSLLFAEGGFLLVLFAAFAGTYALTFLVSAYGLRRPIGQAGLQACSIAFPSVAFMGIPIFEHLFGRSTLVSVSCANALGTMIVVPPTVILLEIQAHRSRTDAATPGAPTAAAGEVSSRAIIGTALWSSLRRPVVWAPLLALALVLLGIRVPHEIDRMLRLIGTTTSGLALFASGLVLAAYQIKLSLDVIGNVLAKMVVQPLCVALLVSAMGVGGPLAHEAVLIFALPTAVFPTLLAPRYGVYVRESASTLILTTLAMVVVLPLAIYLTGG